MNKFYKLALALLPIGAIAQPTITDSWQPGVGETYNFVMVDQNFTFPTAGANQTWDYSNINLGSSLVHDFIDASTTPYAANFPNADMAYSPAGSGSYIYYEATATAFNDWGLQNAQTDVTYSNPLSYLIFPITYGDIETDNASGTIVGGMGTRTTDLEMEGYGYGSLTLPTGTLNNILCVKVTQDITDDYGSIDQSSSSVSYIFVSTSEKYIIFSLNELVQPTQTNRYGFVKSNYVGLNDETAAGEISTSVYPNPVNKGENFNISIDSKESRTVNINVVDVTGKVVNAIGSKSLTTGSNNVSVESDALDAGIYFVNISTDNNAFNSTVKMIVK